MNRVFLLELDTHNISIILQWNVNSGKDFFSKHLNNVEEHKLVLVLLNFLGGFEMSLLSWFFLSSFLSLQRMFYFCSIFILHNEWLCFMHAVLKPIGFNLFTLLRGYDGQDAQQLSDWAGWPIVTAHGKYLLLCVTGSLPAFSLLRNWRRRLMSSCNKTISWLVSTSFNIHIDKKPQTS